MRSHGFNQETLSFRVPCLTGYYGFTLDKIDGLASSGFTFQGPGVKGRWPGADVTLQTWAYLSNLERYGETPIVGRFPLPIEKAA